jgi:hypothetical protein
MEKQPSITLQYVQKDGRRERTKLAHGSMDEARRFAKAVLHAANGLYTEVDVCQGDETVEKIENPAVADPSWSDPKITGCLAHKG